MIEDDIAAVITNDLRRAVEHAIATHGMLTNDHVRAVTILTEEVGEAASEVLTMTRRGITSMHYEFHRSQAVEELAQVAAVAILMVVNLKEGM